MHFAIFTSPSCEKGTFVTEALKTADKIIAADCGANAAVAWDIIPEVVVGDLDSITAETKKLLQKKGCQFVTSSNEKDETDTQIAVTYALEQGATQISLIGGIAGDRVEHTIANISLTYNPKIPVYLVNGRSKSWVMLGPEKVAVEGEKNDLLSLIPLSQIVSRIVTEGLYYPLLNEPLYFGVPRGISNVFAEKKISIEFQSGLLLFVHTKNH